MGKCPSCASWNTLIEEKVVTTGSSSGKKLETKKASVAKRIKEISFEDQPRLLVKDVELNRVLGGGIVPGSLVLIGGEPGIGKSTLMLQLALNVENLKVLYISGEESEQQIKMRADRVGLKSNEDTFVLTETNLDHIFNSIDKIQPQLIIADSIQTFQSTALESVAGSVSQVRQSTGELMKYAKESGVPVFLIGHITKDGSLAGPKVLEHMVDTVLQFEGDTHTSYRILRTTKNRFGSTSELGIYEMQNGGMKEILNPSELLISHRNDNLSGIAIGATMEGNRPILIEVQALVSPAAYGTPQRTSTGFDSKRLNMLLAVLEKRGGFRLGLQDVFINMAGGIKVEDPAIDLAVCVAIISSLEDIPLQPDCVFSAEVGLGGELRGINRLESRISEAEKLGFKEFYISNKNKQSNPDQNSKIDILSLGKLREVFSAVFG